MTKTRVLIVDDEPNIRDLLATSLRFAGFDIQTAANGTAAVAAVTESEPDIILLDVMLPDMNGFSVTKKLRSAGIQAPILFLTARDEVEDKITGLTVGGDDYLTKPFSLDEVVARIQAILRRTKSAEAEPAILDAGPVVINQDAHEVSVEGTLVDLSPTEYKLLRFLIMNADRVLTKAQILDHVWEYDFNGDMGIVESYVSYLRKKIDPISSRPLIQTKRGVGYIYKKCHPS
jgi:two-component system OmpR family response regulator